MKALNGSTDMLFWEFDYTATPIGITKTELKPW